uniref:Uncharacterized protein n=1 Tax=Cacopsylla melanoneura TaxID=428564 RepID=A0A8D8Z282_9HEMI
MAGVYSTRKQRIKRSDRAGRQYKKKNKTQQGVGTQLLELFKNCFSKEQLAFNPRRNYFHLFNLNQNYSINLADLTENYVKLYDQLNLFNIVYKSKEEQSLLKNYTSFIDQALSILKSPFERGLYKCTCYLYKTLAPLKI